MRWIVFSVTIFFSLFASAQNAPVRRREFPPGSISRVEDVPASKLRAKLDRLPAAARAHAVEQLKNFHFTDLDLETLDADEDGGVFYIDNFSLAAPANGQSQTTSLAGPMPVSPFPTNLYFHSRKGAPNILFLNFSGENVSGTAWNTTVGRTNIPATAFSTDSDFTTFSDAEQTAVKRIWQRVSEDYAPFNIDVTTERPATFGTRTAMALITRSTDTNGDANPSSTAGGIAYINVFATSTYATYRPAWIYFDNLALVDSYIAEAASHEIGHNMGLSHDGTSTSGYYGGHGSGETSWAPIMGTGYDHNVSQWSKGEYYDANNTQDDLALISAKISYRTDDHGDTSQAATALLLTGGTNIVSTTPENDPANTNTANKGVLERNTDVDVFSFATGSGGVRLNVDPWITPSGTRGGNLDVSIELRDVNGNVLTTNNAASATGASIQTTLAAGTYYLFVRNSGTGNPTSSVPTGYTPYASIGQYFISGSIAATSAAPPTVQLLAAANNTTWGSVSPTGGTYAAGSAVQVAATPANYFKFVSWTNGATGTADPLSFTIQTNTSVTALFGALMTTNHPTPYWWLASYGYTSNFETAVNAIGANGIPLWQSYLAGLNPTQATSQLRLAVNRNTNIAAQVLNWNTVTGHVYTIWSSTNIAGTFTRVGGASNLAATVKSFTNNVPASSPRVFYKLEVQPQ